MQVAPIVDVVGEQIGGEAELLHSEQLALRHVLIVLEPVPCGQLWVLPLGFGQRGKRHFRGLIGIGVDHGLEPALVHLGDPLGEVVLGNVRDSVGESLVVARPLKQPGVALDRSIDDELDAAEAWIEIGARER